jgi:Protein of unknown function (DUF3616)
MTGQPLTSTQQVRLDLSLPDVSDLSTVCRDGSLLWLAGDEKPSRVIRLAADGAGAYADPAPFPLAECVDLPEGPNEEVDIEALDIRDQHLWVIGSHSATRKQARPHDSEKEARENLRTVEQHPNRNLILRLALDGDGNDRRPVSAAPGSQGAPRCYTGLREALADDKHLGPFLPIPGKDNGLDIEGLTALDDTLLLGLRGPVLRGWAVLLGVDPTALTPASKDSYRKFFLDLGGLGIRDLCRIDDDVLILAGPTMDLDGPTRLYRWPGAATTRTTTVLTDDQFIRYDLARDPAATEGTDHPEGVTGLSGGDPAEVLVIYDSPSAARAPDDDSTLADIYALPPA